MALKNADSLYRISNTDSYRFDALFLKAKILRQYGLRNEAISFALQADSVISVAGDDFRKARINGFISTLYRENGIPSSGKTYLGKALRYSKGIRDHNNYCTFLGNYYMDQAYYSMSEEDYKAAIRQLNDALDYFDKLTPDADKYFFIASTQQLLAKNYLFSNQPDSAFSILTRAQESLSKSKSANSPLKGFIYHDIGLVFMAKNDFAHAYDNYRQSLEIAEQSGFSNLKLEVYKSLSRYFKTIKDDKNYVIYNDKYLGMLEREQAVQKEVADMLVAKLYVEDAKRSKKQQLTIMVIIGACIIVVICLYLFYKNKRRKDYEKYTRFIAQFSSPGIDPDPRLTEEAPENNTSTVAIPDESLTLANDDIVSPEEIERENAGGYTGEHSRPENEKEYISKDTEDKILKRLETFERTRGYLKKNISLSQLASRFEVNSRYLSYVVNRYKLTNFESYINDLRIQYIVHKLKTEPQYLEYKISHLAENAGFSSYSSFNSAFKKSTELLPSTFINYVKEEKKIMNSKPPSIDKIA